jgi:hypothetical protein
MARVSKMRTNFEIDIRKRNSDWRRWSLLERFKDGYEDLIVNDEWKVWKRSWKAAMKVRGDHN